MDRLLITGCAQNLKLAFHWYLRSRFSAVAVCCPGLARTSHFWCTDTARGREATSRPKREARLFQQTPCPRPRRGNVLRGAVPRFRRTQCKRLACTGSEAHHRDRAARLHPFHRRLLGLLRRRLRLSRWCRSWNWWRSSSKRESWSWKSRSTRPPPITTRVDLTSVRTSTTPRASSSIRFRA